MGVCWRKNGQIPSLGLSGQLKQTHSPFPNVCGNFPWGSLVFCFPRSSPGTKSFHQVLLRSRVCLIYWEGKKKRIRNARQLILNAVFNYWYFIIYFSFWTANQDDQFLEPLIKFCWCNVTFQTSLSANCVALSLWIFISLELQAIFFNSPRFHSLNFHLTLNVEMTHPEQHHVSFVVWKVCFQVWWMG